MKTITDVLEKLRVDDIILNDRFPIDGTLKEMMQFLEENGFKYVECRSDIDECFNKYKSKCFYKNNEYLWFGDTSKEEISKKNPIFTYRILQNNFSVYYCGTSGRIYWLVGELGKIKNSKENKEEFLRELNKRFGW